MLDKVSLHQVEVFCAVIEAGGFARAAERLLIFASTWARDRGRPRPGGGRIVELRGRVSRR
jgi:DNA-binding transcriptional LysR family regulator